MSSHRIQAAASLIGFDPEGRLYGKDAGMKMQSFVNVEVGHDNVGEGLKVLVAAIA